MIKGNDENALHVSKSKDEKKLGFSHRPRSGPTLNEYEASKDMSNDNENGRKSNDEFATTPKVSIVENNCKHVSSFSTLFHQVFRFLKISISIQTSSIC